MTLEAHQASGTTTRDTSTTVFQLVYAVVLVGAGMLAVLALIYGIAHSRTVSGDLWAAVGMVAYLAVWGWGILLAQSD